MATPIFIYANVLYSGFTLNYMARSTELKRPKYVWMTSSTEKLEGVANSIVNVAEREPRESSPGVNTSLDKF
jgi:hypothetical protein